MQIFTAEGNTFCVHTPCQNLHLYPILNAIKCGMTLRTQKLDTCYYAKFFMLSTD